MYFDTENRLANDKCWIEGQNKQSRLIQEYWLYNPYKTNTLECADSEAKLRHFMVENKKHYREGYGVTNACNIDKDSEFRTSKRLTHGRGKTQLNTRIFQAVPDMSNGGFESLLESRLTQGIRTAEKKSCEKTKGKGFDTMTPMIPCLRKTVQNPDHIVPTQWIRGGEPTRDHVKQKDFMERNGYVFDEKVWSKKECNV